MNNKCQYLFMVLIICSCNPAPPSQIDTEVMDSAVKVGTQIRDSIPSMPDSSTPEDLSGMHNLTLQWLSFNDRKPGLASLQKTDYPHVYTIQGEQRNDAGYLTIDGKISVRSPKELVFDGLIQYRVADSNRDLCRKEGQYIFLSTKNRAYWRLQDMSGCGSSDTDYIDLYF